MKFSEIFIILFGTGSITVIAQLIISNSLNKKFYRFSNLFKDKLDIIREFYKLLVRAEKALTLLMSNREPEAKYGEDGNLDDESKKKLDEYRVKTYDTIDAFFDFFDQNEIVFEKEIVNLVSELREKFDNARKAQTFAAMFESSRGTKPWEKAIDKKVEAIELYVVKEIPELKSILKIYFQEQYKILKSI